MNDKLKMHTPNKADENFAKLAALFPNAVTETKDEHGDVVRAIDKDILMQEISATVVEGADERYQFTWPDKKKSILLANAPINKTLRPCKEESVNFDTTENLYIEGDNLEVLKLLQETYLGKIKMIYIDPPYNTGNDFVYEDDFAQSTEEYLSNSGQYDESGNRLFKNIDSNGRFHTDWLNMMYTRIKLSKDLLSDDGVIFISIDDNEQDNLRKICNEIFGEQNFVSNIIWKKKYGIQNDAKYFSSNHDFVLLYAKNIALYEQNLLPRTAEANERYKNPDNDPRGPWKAGDMSVGRITEKDIYEITTPSGRKVLPSAGNSWRLSKETFEEYLKDNRIWFGAEGNNVPAIKRFLSEVKDGTTCSTIWEYTEVGHSDKAKKCVKDLFDGKAYFDYPKSVDLIKRMLILATHKDSIVLDFFSGSATTAHSIMQLNVEDNGNRKYIMVQLQEETLPKSDAYKDGYTTICEIGKERIRRAAKKIAEENPDAKFDGGFRVLKCDSSNMKDVYYNPSEFEPSFLDTMEDNIKEDRTPEDLLFQVMLDLGVLLSSKIEETTIVGKKVFNVADNFLIACFDKEVNDEVIKEIAQNKPYYFVMRDSSMANDSVATNFEQIFATYSPDTVRKVL